MRHYWDECPYHQDEQEIRLRAARILSQAGIPCLIHGEDALAFILFVPTGLWALHIVVPDRHLLQAKAAILGALPYHVFTGIDGQFNEPIFVDPNETRAYPRSVFLEECSPPGTTQNPHMILIHPETYLNLDVTDYSRSVPLPPFPDNIRFPTKAAFLDSTIELRLDPNSGLIAERMATLYSVWIGYVVGYCIRTDIFSLPNGDLVPDAEALKRSLKPENQPQLDAYFRGNLSKALNVSQQMVIRREVLRSLGKTDLADKPLPRFPPGNPEFFEKLRTDPNHRHQFKTYNRAFRSTPSEQSATSLRVTPHPSGQSRSFSTSTSVLRGTSSFIRLARKVIL